MAKQGDLVKIKTADEEFKGILMPRPEILDKGITVIKLDNGYNIGIKKSRIKKIETVKEHKEKKIKKQKLKHNPKLPAVTIISTGGTISSRVDYTTGAVNADYSAEDFVAMCPELQNIANIKAKQLMLKMSEDIDSNDWINIAKAVEKELKHSDGIIITQGTDTLHYTTAALSFFLKNLSKPVVVTAAQRSIDRGSSDAFMNLVCAAKAATSDIAEVMSCMHGTASDDYCLLIRGSKTRKMHTSRRDSFRPINDLPIAKAYPDKIEIIDKKFNKKSAGTCSLDAVFEEKTAIIYVYPGMDSEIIDYYVKKGYKGLVIAATALGHVPTEGKKSLIPNIKKAIDRGVLVVIASQTLYGRVHPYVYTNLRKLSIEAGCIFAQDMTPETAYVKLGWALKHKNPKELFLSNVAGEINERSLDKTFLY